MNKWVPSFCTVPTKHNVSYKLSLQWEPLNILSASLFVLNNTYVLIGCYRVTLDSIFSFSEYRCKSHWLGHDVCVTDCFCVFGSWNNALSSLKERKREAAAVFWLSPIQMIVSLSNHEYFRQISGDAVCALCTIRQQHKSHIIVKKGARTVMMESLFGRWAVYDMIKIMLFLLLFPTLITAIATTEQTFTVAVKCSAPDCLSL